MAVWAMAGDKLRMGTHNEAVRASQVLVRGHPVLIVQAREVLSAKGFRSHQTSSQFWSYQRIQMLGQTCGIREPILLLKFV